MLYTINHDKRKTVYCLIFSSIYASDLITWDMLLTIKQRKRKTVYCLIYSLSLFLSINKSESRNCCSYVLIWDRAHLFNAIFWFVGEDILRSTSIFPIFIRVFDIPVIQVKHKSNRNKGDNGARWLNLYLHKLSQYVRNKRYLTFFLNWENALWVWKWCSWYCE